MTLPALFHRRSHAPHGRVLDRQGEHDLLEAKLALFAAAGRADEAAAHHDEQTADRWRQRASRARINLCRVIGDEDLAKHWTAWHDQQWPAGGHPAPDPDDLVNLGGPHGWETKAEQRRDDNTRDVVNPGVLS